MKRVKYQKPVARELTSLAAAEGHCQTGFGVSGIGCTSGTSARACKSGSSGGGPPSGNCNKPGLSAVDCDPTGNTAAFA